MTPTSRKRSVILIAKGYLPDAGGIERYSRDMAQAYSALGYCTYVLTQCSGPPGIWRDGDVLVENVGQGGGQICIFFRMLWRWRVLRGRHVDMVHATTWRVSAPAFVLRPSAPLVVTVHGREVLIASGFLKLLMNHILSRADVVVAVSPTIARLARALVTSAKGRWLIAWNGLSFSGAPINRVGTSKPLRIYTFCRLVERKNVENAVRAVSELIRRGRENFCYVIAGDGPMRGSLSLLINELHLETHVTLLGHIPEGDICELYQKADIFLHPQITTANGRDIEGFGLTIADAMSFGAVAVAGKDGGPADFIEDGKTGVLVDGRSPVEIADALEQLLDNDALRLRVAEAGCMWVKENLSWRKSAEAILASLPVR